MSQDSVVYDLGEVTTDPSGKAVDGARPADRVAGAGASLFSSSVAATAAPPRPASRRVPRARSGGWPPGAPITASLSVVFPGAGQLVAGDIGFGLFLVSWTGLSAALAWAVLATYERLVPVLDVLGWPAFAPVWALAAAFVLTAFLHVGGALHAQALGAHYRPDDYPLHPVPAAIASALLPGWGQLLNGHRARAAMFLIGMWGLSGAWLVLEGPRHPALRALAEPLADMPRLPWGMGLLITVAAVMWSVAIYDAIAGAVSRRRRWLEGEAL